MTTEREPGDETEETAASLSTQTAPPSVSFPKTVATFEELWKRALPVVAKLIPKHLTPERIYALAATARARNPRLMECTNLSILRGVIQAAQLGLDVSGVGGQAWLVPYKNKYTGQYEAQMQVGYQGLVELSRRGGRVVSVRAREVYELEKFRYEDGAMPVLWHEPFVGDEDPGPVICAWAIAVFKDGVIQAEVMSRRQIEQVRKSSRAGDDGPWTTHYPQMARKSVIRRLCKTLPQDSELGTALDIEDRAEAGEKQDLDYELAGLDETALESGSRTAEVKKVLKGKKA